MEEIEDEVVNIIGIDSDLLLFVEDDRSETLIKDDDNVEVEDNEKVESKPNEKKKRGRKKSLVKQLRKKENPVECGDCTKIFTTLRSLQRHKKFIHELQGLSNCDICGKDVQQGLGGLRRHKQIVHEKLRDKCDLCEKFVFKGGLPQHKRRHHPPPNCEYCKLIFKNLEEFDEHTQDHISGKIQ